MLQTGLHVAETHWWAVFIPTDAVSAWTMVLALATLGVAVIAGVGLRSLSMTRADFKTRNTREVAQRTIELCEDMCEDILPNLNSFIKGLSAKGIAYFVNDASQVSFKADEEVKKINAAISWMQKLDPDLIERSIVLCNKLECWAMCFTHNPAIANETVAFEPCSSVYCQMVMVLYPALLTQRRLSPASGPFQNLVTLFEGWYSKKQQAQLLEQLKRAKEDQGRLPPLIGGNES